MDGKAYVFNSNAQKFLERVLDFSLTSSNSVPHSEKPWFLGPKNSK